MYTTLIAWLKTYTDLYMTKYYDEDDGLKWMLNDTVQVSIVGNDDEDAIPAGSGKSTYPFKVDFIINKLDSSKDELTTAFESLLDDLTQLYIRNDYITYDNNTFKITNISHRPYENESLYWYELQINLTHTEYLT